MLDRGICSASNEPGFFSKCGFEQRPRHGERWLGGWKLIAIPALTLGLVRICLAHFFPETHELIDDWYLHAIFFLAFLFGWIPFARHPAATLTTGCPS